MNMSLKTFKQIKVLVISDVHLGHPKTTSAFIVENLKNSITENVIKDLDLFIIAGDLFDRLLMFNQECVYIVAEYFTELLALLHTHKVIFRVLEGTPSHDWQQSRILLNLNNSRKEPVDFKYISKLQVEHIDDLNLDILYIPDEHSSDVSVTLADAKNAIMERNLNTVHLAVMHGAFDYQLPFPIKTHNYEEYSNLVSHYIFIGHHHEHNPKRKVIPPGSFDRLCHGDENPKGFIVATIGKTFKESCFTFVKNEKAKAYRTINIQDKPLEEVYDILENLNLPFDSYIRLHLKRSDIAFSSLSKIKKNYNGYNFTVLVADDKESVKPSKTSELKNYEPIFLTKETLPKVIISSLKDRDDPNLTDEMLAYIEEIVLG